MIHLFFLLDYYDFYLEIEAEFQVEKRALNPLVTQLYLNASFLESSLDEMELGVSGQVVGERSGSLVASY